jgi:hypothetical protein
VDAANLKLLAGAAGSELQMPVEFVPPPGGQRRRDLFLTGVSRDQPPFSLFGDSLAAVTGTLRFSGGLASRRLEGALADDILATYSDRSACLVISPCGAGALAVLNLDLEASNLPASPAFVPLVGELMGRLLGRQRFGEGPACGEPLAVHLPPAAGPVAGLKVIGPEPAEDPGRLVEESGGVLWHQQALGKPGVYQVKRGNDTVFAVAAAVPPEEGDLRPLDPDVLRDRLAGGRAVHFHAAAREGEGRHDLWTWMAVACVACLFGEILALKLFRT